MPIVTLLTDYGLADTYVGQLKGAILTIAPAAVLVDLTHSTPPQDVRTGAFLLWTAVTAFPPSSIHVAIVDPGVGTERPAVAVQSARGDVLVGPDNGLLVPALERLGGATAIVELTDSRFWRLPPSATFHGRDIFGPVAAHLARGVPFSHLGTAIPKLQVPFAIPLPYATAEGLRGEVIYIDGFGTLVTNVPGNRVGATFTVQFKGRQIRGRSGASFQSVAPGCPVAVIGSSGLLELAIRDGSAASALDGCVGDLVLLETA